jgi:hypothetical protein
VLLTSNKGEKHMMKYRVYNSDTGKDVTNEKDWMLIPTGELMCLSYCNDEAEIHKAEECFELVNAKIAFIVRTVVRQAVRDCADAAADIDGFNTHKKNFCGLFGEVIADLLNELLN